MGVYDRKTVDVNAVSGFTEDAADALGDFLGEIVHSEPSERLLDVLELPDLDDREKVVAFFIPEGIDRLYESAAVVAECISVQIVGLVFEGSVDEKEHHSTDEITDELRGVQNLKNNGGKNPGGKDVDRKHLINVKHFSFYREDRIGDRDRDERCHVERDHERSVLIYKIVIKVDDLVREVR